MFPPPTTTATETPARETSAISSAMARVVLTSTPVSVPANASPEIFRRTRLYCGLLSECILHKTTNLDVLPERAYRGADQVVDRQRIVLHKRLIQQHVFFVPLVQLALDDFCGDFGGLPGGNRFGKLFLLSGDDVGRYAVPVEVGRRHRRNVHGNVAGQLRKLWIARNEVGLTIDLDKHADLAAGVDVRRNESLVSGTFGFLFGLRRTALEQQLFRLDNVTFGLDERLAAIHHGRTGVFAQGLDFVGFRLIRHSGGHAFSLKCASLTVLLRLRPSWSELRLLRLGARPARPHTPFRHRRSFRSRYDPR